MQPIPVLVKRAVRWVSDVARGFTFLRGIAQNPVMPRAGLPPHPGVESALRDAVDARLHDLELDYKAGARLVGIAPNTLRQLGETRINKETRAKLTGLGFTLAQIDELVAADIHKPGGRKPTVATIAVLCDALQPWKQDLVLDMVRALSKRSREGQSD